MNFHLSVPAEDYTPERLAMLFMKLNVIAFFVVWCFTASVAYTQQEASNWFFGYGAGLQFNGANPEFQPGKINQWEGCASISDFDGKLLFYTDGRTVWNKHHLVMENGRSLKGHNSSTQSSVIIPHPGRENQYYVFTVAVEGSRDGLHYSIVDMEQEEGNGAVTEKNLALFSPVCEKITGVRHQNNKDIWVISHRYDSDEYLAWLITADGLQPEPVISPSGNHVTGKLNTIGYLKVSADGRKLAAAHFTTFIEVADFDNRTGSISNFRKIVPASGRLTMGVEFSPDGGYLYATQTNRPNGKGDYSILQYPVLSDAQAMMQQQILIDSGNIGGAAGALQLGPDGKMYVAFNGMSFLGRISKPSLKGKDSNFELEAVRFPGSYRSGLGLPAFIQSYFQGGRVVVNRWYYLAALCLLTIVLFYVLRKKRKQQSPRKHPDHPKEKDQV